MEGLIMKNKDNNNNKWEATTIEEALKREGQRRLQEEKELEEYETPNMDFIARTLTIDEVADRLQVDWMDMDYYYMKLDLTEMAIEFERKQAEKYGEPFEGDFDEEYEPCVSIYDFQDTYLTMKYAEEYAVIREAAEYLSGEQLYETSYGGEESLRTKKLIKMYNDAWDDKEVSMNELMDVMNFIIDESDNRRERRQKIKEYVDSVYEDDEEEI